METTLPYAGADSSFRALAGVAEGFGRFAVGGAHGPLHHVTSLSDEGPGSLREACHKKEPLWIVFEISGTIHLSSYLNVSSHKTIDGRGQRIKLTGKGLRLKECENIIICNLEFEGGRGDDVDGHDKTMLIGADPTHIDDRCIRVTIHHCFFDGTRQRHPRLRFGKVHLYNNYTRNWGVYAICASVEAQIYSQCNIYEAGQKKKAFEFYAEKQIRRKQDQVRRGLALKWSSTMPIERSHWRTHVSSSEFYPNWTMEPASDSLKHILQPELVGNLFQDQLNNVMFLLLHDLFINLF
ncbi:hypothetical protein L1987_35093 [Smallanthus sonchifolius]|uniref:Uncharacterized protein n=1 Tax=Smallanthus sonchifolius TaxID=185202 RepID=A0ACB9HXD8_9ASTR|nr:hypothetical protein L1987_35093 [Smallanthus sonchifolius]